MKKKLLLLCFLHLILNGQSFSKEKPGVIFFGNFNYLNSKRKDLKKSFVDVQYQEYPEYSTDNTEEEIIDEIADEVLGSTILEDAGIPEIGKEANDKFEEPPPILIPVDIKPEQKYIFFDNKWLSGKNQTSQGDLIVSGNGLNSGMGSLQSNYVITNIDTVIVKDKDRYANIGMVSMGGGEIINEGNISVNGTLNSMNAGMLLYDKGGVAINKGKIDVDDNQVGIYGVIGSEIENQKDIEVNFGTGMVVEHTGTIINTGKIVVHDNSYGIFGHDHSSIINNGQIILHGSNTIGLEASQGSNVENNGYIHVEKGDAGIYAHVDSVLKNNGIIYVYSGNGIYVDISQEGSKVYNNENGTIFVYLDGVGIRLMRNSYAENNGYIALTSGIGMYAYNNSEAINNGTMKMYTNSVSIGMVADKSSKVINNGMIDVVGPISMGMKAFENSSAINAGMIDIEEEGQVGMYGGKTANLTNSITGTIKVSTGTGMEIVGGKAENYGKIAVSNSGIGILAGRSNPAATAINYGTIEVSGSKSVAMKTNNKIGVLVNEKDGVIKIENGATGSYAFSMVNGAIANNYGTLSLGDSGRAASNGTLHNYGMMLTGDSEYYEYDRTEMELVMEKEGSVEGKLREGIVGISYMPQLFSPSDKEKTKLDLSFKADTYIPYSAMYDITSMGEDVYVQRKNFEIISNNGLGKYLEAIYSTYNSTTQEKMLHILQKSRTLKQFNENLNKFFGRDLYTSVLFQTKDNINYAVEKIISNLGEQGDNYIAGYTLDRFNKKNQSGEIGHREYLNGFYFGRQFEINRNWDVGGIFSYTRADSTYKSDIGKRDDNFLQGTAYLNYRNAKSVSGIGMVYLGYSTGKLNRNLKIDPFLNEELRSDLKNIYLGIAGKVAKKYSFDSFYIEPKLEGNLNGIFQRKIDEKNGEFALEFKKTENLFSDLKIGTGIGKVFYPNQNYMINFEIKGNLVQELNSEIKDLNVKMKNVSQEKGKIEVKRKNQFSKELGIKLELSQRENKSFSLYTEYAYSFENQDSWKIDTGFICRFN
jgi:hypothetical protein